MFRPVFRPLSGMCTQECTIGCVRMVVSEQAENMFGPKTDWRSDWIN